MSAKIKSVEPDSIAYELGLKPCDEIISINGETFTDALEYRFLIADENIDLLVRTKDGEEIIYEIEKDEYEDLGINFNSSLIDKPRSCRNKCIFCFIDQLPKGLRSPLYFKDDDTRLSFLNGNYVTLTNIDDGELKKIIKMKLSPINVSVHTTDGELRKNMLRNKNAGDVVEKIKKLTDGGITVNCQIVLVKDVNDGKNLEKTISDLSGFYPLMHSISVVPVGISDHREGLYPLKEFTPDDAVEVIGIINDFQKKFKKTHNSNIVYAADEFYVKGDIEIPDAKEYEDFPQIENGVGMLASFEEGVKTAISASNSDKKSRKTVVTGKCSYKYIKKAAETIEKNFKNVKIDVIAAENKLFGEKITVSGLLCGRDILDALKGRDVGDGIIISRDTLRAEGDIFLDDMTKEEFEEKAGVRVYYADSEGTDFVDACLS